ncbi:Tm-1-like ATP-binding domain-containing protein [Propionibacterium acidifaciens]|uniref:Tm-1-like ATP-binding domain-containing protein n=1 Tax=Propionibacterium acidifaciens TaxID=556499 RepID=UPI0028E250E0|nr:Tm-1-like ATP-binding domain-containing protein [Propionibacterium acidifaciens]
MSGERPVIVCAGMCNTKGNEIRFLAEKVRGFGGDPLILDLSLGASVDFADIPVREVLAAVGVEQASTVFTAPRSEAIETVGAAGAAMAQRLVEEGRLDGIISWAGSVGTTTVTRVMRALPFGVPKIMLTDMASADVSMWLGNKDIFIASPTAEQGINAVTYRIVSNACAAVVAMAKVPNEAPDVKPLAAVTSYGTTTPTQLHITRFFESKGWDCGTFHAVGVGATMEDLIRSGVITAVVDMTPGELTNNMYDSFYGIPKTWDGERMTAASDVGIPQVVAPGGLDQAAYNGMAQFAPEYLEDFRTGKRRGPHGSDKPYVHNEGVTIMVPTLDEIVELSAYMAERLNRTTGPTCFIIPMRGWSAYDQSEEIATRDRGWAEGNGDGPVWEPDEKCPRWSRRATLMWKELHERLDPEKVDLIAIDHHILDEEFSELAETIVWDMINGDWRIGKYEDVGDKVLDFEDYDL